MASSVSIQEAFSRRRTMLKEKPRDPIWLPAIVLATSLYLMYSPVFLTDYLVNDEWEFIGTNPGLRQSAIEAFFYWGRGLFGIYCTLVFRFIGYDPLRVQIVRFLNFASIVVMALALFVFLTKTSKHVWFSFLVTLFLFSTASFQELMAYSLILIANTQPAMWLGLLAFYLYFYVDDGRLSKPLRLGAAFLLLILAMQSTQTFAFFCMVPLAYLALSDWENQRRKAFEFLTVSALVFVVSTLTFKAGLHYWHARGFQGYKLGEQAMEAGGQHPLRMLFQSINPLSYWSAFEISSYPFPFNTISALARMKHGIALGLMGTWAVILGWAILLESRDRAILVKWLSALVCLGFGAVFIVADSPLVTIEHRPHILITFVGVAIICAAYSLQVLARRYQALSGTVPKVLAILLVAMSAWGAQAGTLQGYVIDRMRLLDFIRTEVMAKDPSTYRNIVVVLPEARAPGLRQSWVGKGAEGRYHMSKIGGYRYALATIGIPPESKTITIVDGNPTELPPDSAVIDWRKLSRQAPH